MNLNLLIMIIYATRFYPRVVEFCVPQKVGNVYLKIANGQMQRVSLA